MVYAIIGIVIIIGLIAEFKTTVLGILGILLLIFLFYGLVYLLLLLMGLFGGGRLGAYIVIFLVIVGLVGRIIGSEDS